MQWTPRWQAKRAETHPGASPRPDPIRFFGGGSSSFQGYQALDVTPYELVHRRPLGESLSLLGQGSPGSYRPQVLYDIPAHADVPVVKIHGRVAVPGNEQELFAERRWIGPFDEAVLVGGLGELEDFFSPDSGHARVDARGLEAGVDDCGVGRGPAHHRGEDEEGVLEARERCGPCGARVIDVHEDVGAGLDLVPCARLQLEHEGAAASAGDDRGVDTVALEERLGGVHGFGGASDVSAALGHRSHVLRAAVVGLQAAEAQAGGSRNLTRQGERRLAGRDAAAAHADFELDIDVEARAAGGNLVQVVEVVDANSQMRTSGKRAKARDLRRSDDLVADEEVLHATLD